MRKQHILELLEKLWMAIENYADELDTEAWGIMEEAYNELETVVLKPLPHAEIINLLDNDSETIAWKVWTYEDVVDFINTVQDRELRERLAKYKIDPEDVANNGDSYWKALSDCTDQDWDIIAQGVYQVTEQLIKEREVES